MSADQVTLKGARGSMRDYAVVTGAYWVFTLTDGALRTLVLLHLADLGHGALAIAGYFVVYELLGVVTNLGGGWLGARFGLKLPLVAGLLVQLLTCFLFASGADAPTVALLVLGQGASGVAKDLVKSSAKSYVKLVVPAGEHGRLMQLVSLLTGSKNALKGVGFLLGGVLLEGVGFANACWGMAAALALACVAAATLLPPAPGRARAVRWRGLFAHDRRLDRLAAARLFLFAARDVWFVLALPVFLRAALGWSFTEVSLFLALWTIGYGIAQASAPRWIGREPNARPLLGWGLALLVPLALMTVLLHSTNAPPADVLIAGLALFGLVFAANSALHSFLVVRYAAEESAALDVGFYYASNATGRLVGTALSGWLYQSASDPTHGLVACLLAATTLAAAAFVAGIPLVRAERDSPTATRER